MCWCGMKALFPLVLYFTIALTSDRNRNSQDGVERDYNLYQVVGIDDVIRVHTDSKFPICKFYLEVLCSGRVNVTRISTEDNIIDDTMEVEVRPSNSSIYRPQAETRLCFSWRNKTHLSPPIYIDAMEEFELLKVRHTATFYERYGKGYFNIDVSWRNPLTDVNRQPRCWVSGDPQATCMLRNATSVRIYGILSRVAVKWPIRLQVSVDEYCAIALSPIHLKYTDCPEGSTICLPPCTKPDNQVNASVAITEDSLEVSWLPPLGAEKQQLAVYAVRWGYASLQPGESPNQFEVTEGFCWKKAGKGEMQTANFMLEDIEEDDVIVQVVPLCQDKLSVLHKLDNCTYINDDKQCKALFDDIFLPGRVNGRVTADVHHEFESSQRVEQGDVVSVTVFVNDTVRAANANDTLDPVDVGVEHVEIASVKPDREKKARWVEVVVPVISVILLLVCLLTAGILHRRKHLQTTNGLRKLLQPNPLYHSLYKNIGEADKWEIGPECIAWGDEVGCGAFGSVYKCVLRDVERMSTVAVKTLTVEHCSGLAKQQFIQEMLVMKELEGHANIVRLIGCVTLSEPFCLITEFAVNGDLLSYLHSIRLDDSEVDYENTKGLGYGQLLQMAMDIATGMEYVSSKGYIHRDLATRNLLLDGSYTVKIADFGLARYLHTEDVYIVQNSKRLPVKWLSVEALADLVFSPASDVWAFGVVLYELVTLGETPYPAIDPTDMLTYLSLGHRMDRPASCDFSLYNVMSSCWRTNASTRPTFSELRDTLADLCPDYECVESTDSLSNEIFVSDVDEGFAADCASQYRSHLTSESSNFSDVSMIIASPQLQHKSVNVADSRVQPEWASVRIDRSSEPIYGEDQVNYNQEDFNTRL